MCHGVQRIALVALILVGCNDGIVGPVNGWKNSNSAAQENRSSGRVGTWSSDETGMSGYQSYSSAAQGNKERNFGFSDNSYNSRVTQQNLLFDGNFQPGTGFSNFESHYQINGAASNNGFGKHKGSTFRAPTGSNYDSGSMNPKPNNYNDDSLKFTSEQNIRNEYNHKNWDFETKTEGYGDSGIWPGNKRKDSNSVGNGRSDSSFAENTSQFSNGWSPLREESKTESCSDTSSDKQGEKHRGNPNNWNSGINTGENLSGKEGSGTNGNINKWKSKPVNHNARPTSLSGTDNWYKEIDAGKQSSFLGNSSPNKNVKDIDWSKLERENKKSVLILDLSQLWNTNNAKERGKSPIFRLTKKREVERQKDANGANTCICMEYDDCQPKDRVQLVLTLENIIHDLRYSNVLNCRVKGKACCSARALTENEEVAEYRKISSINRLPTCGKRLTEHISHDSNGGSLADHGDFPWILRLLYLRDDGNSINERLQCGASLVHRSIALTTASCVLSATPESLSAISGEWNTVTGHERNYIRERKVRKIVVHPKFDAFHFTNDLALLFLDDPLENSHAANTGVDTLMNTVCLPVPIDRWHTDRCMIVGWSFKNENGENQPLLKKIDVAIMSQGKCRNRFNALESDRSYFGLDDSTFICAHAQHEEDLCLDDGGASLVCPSEFHPDSYVQIGFISQKTVCSQERRTATFITIFNILDWISQLETNYFPSES